MGSGSSTKKEEPISTTVQTTLYTTAPTPATDLEASEVKCWIDHEILYMSLAFICGILLTVLVFAIIYLLRKKHKKSHQNLREEVCPQTATEESVRNHQNEVTYSTLVFQRGRTPLAV